MPSTISAGTTTGTAIVVAGDTTGNLAFQTNGTTTAMTIDNSQNVGIGETTAGSYRLNIKTSASQGMFLNGTGTGGSWMAWANSGTAIGYLGSAYHLATSGSASDYSVRSEANLVFCTNGANERMRISSNGNVGIGGTSSFKFDVRNNGAVSQVTAYFANEGTNSTVNNLYSVIPSQSFNTNSSHFAGQTAGTNTWLLYGNGTTSYSSDANLKKNIVTTRDGYIDDVAKLRVVKYQWKANSDDSAVELGLIAQEVAEVFPGLVKDETAISPDGTKGATSKVILGSVFQPILIKCVQELNTMIKEQQAQIEELKAEIAALKGAQ